MAPLISPLRHWSTMGVIADVNSAKGVLIGDQDSMMNGTFFRKLYAMSKRKSDSALHCVCVCLINYINF